MSDERRATVRDLLLTRRGLAFVSSKGGPLSEEHVRAVELELAGVGHVLSTRLRARVAVASLDELAAFRAWAVSTLAAHVGGGHEHQPLYRHFPDGVPDDTAELWWSKVLVHFLQVQGQPCLFCRRIGTTHVLAPCRHVVCDHCFDGSNYSACPICHQRVDRTSPFFRPAPERGAPAEKVVFKLIDLGENVHDAAKSLFVTLCERTQALSPVDRDALVTILDEYGVQVLAWLPRTIPVRENVAIVFGTLFAACSPSDVLPHAKRFMTTATDVLRFIAVLSGTDGSLLRETVFKTVEQHDATGRFWGHIAELFGANLPQPSRRTVTIALRVSRFKTAKLSRPLRRALLGVLEGLDPDRLVEDMLRHRSYWVWAGEFLHPHEYAKRFPNVARAFHVVRKRAPDGTRAPPFRTWNSRLEAAIQTEDSDAMPAVLSERPGSSRADWITLSACPAKVRPGSGARGLHRRDACAGDACSRDAAQPPPTRGEKADIRVYWPKGRVAMGVSSPDGRAVLPRTAIDPAVRAIDAQLLRRFSAKPAFAGCLIDEGLRTIILPFNERTASRSAVSLPRGSRVPVPTGKRVRLFLHWCQPESGGRRTDLDLSVGLYDAAWRFVGVCSYYQLQATGPDGARIAASSGDLTNAPWPDGATEFVDVHRDAGRRRPIRRDGGE